MNRMKVIVDGPGGFGGLLPAFESRIINLGYEPHLWKAMRDFLQNDKLLMEATLASDATLVKAIDSDALVTDMKGKVWTLKTSVANFRVEFF